MTTNSRFYKKKLIICRQSHGIIENCKLMAIFGDWYLSKKYSIKDLFQISKKNDPLEKYLRFIFMATN
jgi:hypothetical protein